MKYDSLGDRMKDYENVSRIYLTKKMPIIIRIDGKAFHTLTRKMDRPFDDSLISMMQQTALCLCQNVMGCKLAYTQSDEISLLLTDYEKIESQPWFGSNLQKMVSIAASMATMSFNNALRNAAIEEVCNYSQHTEVLLEAAAKGAMFDARAFVLPREEVCNYFIWRQQDAIRNSIQMVAQANFPSKELDGKSQSDCLKMLLDRGIDWSDYSIVKQRGSCVVKMFEVHNGESIRMKWAVDDKTPLFVEERKYIDRFVFSGGNN